MCSAALRTATASLSSFAARLAAARSALDKAAWAEASPAKAKRVSSRNGEVVSGPFGVPFRGGVLLELHTDGSP
eukprot:4145191-Alexandrium_andersonii.AAC.1